MKTLLIIISIFISSQALIAGKGKRRMKKLTVHTIEQTIMLRSQGLTREEISRSILDGIVEYAQSIGIKLYKTSLLADSARLTKALNYFFTSNFEDRDEFLQNSGKLGKSLGGIAFTMAGNKYAPGLGGLIGGLIGRKIGWEAGVWGGIIVWKTMINKNCFYKLELCFV